MQLTENFNLSEFKSKDGADFPEKVVDQIKILANNLQILRDEIGKPITINSGYRSPEHNKAIKGAKDSFHVKGMAADIDVDGLTPKEVFDKIEELQGQGLMDVGGLGLYDNFCHYDTFFDGKNKRRWDFRNKK